MTVVTVGTDDLRQALRAVSVHADPDPEFAQLHRVRLEIGSVNLTVTATNRYTVGHAIVSIEDGDGEVAKFDLSPQDVKEILGLFKGSKDGQDEFLRLEVTDELLTVTDISGLFAGKALSLPRYATDDNFPNIEKLLHTKLTAGTSESDRIVTNGQLLGLFTAAAKAYSEALVIDTTPVGYSMVITCGESFLGLLTAIRPDEDLSLQIDGWHSAWLRRLVEYSLTIDETEDTNA
ncbi:hypothetical protein ACSMXN_09355 [Jatrophihabitans sp. DSM 45814]